MEIANSFYSDNQQNKISAAPPKNNDKQINNILHDIDSINHLNYNINIIENR